MIFVVLGNYLNDDGSMSKTLTERLNLTMNAYKKFLPSHIICSGGIANKKAKVPESKPMKQFLIDNGINDAIIIEESNSLSTKENALYSSKIIKELNDNEVIVISSFEHFTKYPYNVIKYFTDVLPNHYIMTFTFSKGE